MYSQYRGYKPIRPINNCCLLIPLHHDVPGIRSLCVSTIRWSLRFNKITRVDSLDLPNVKFPRNWLNRRSDVIEWLCRSDNFDEYRELFLILEYRTAAVQAQGRNVIVGHTVSVEMSLHSCLPGHCSPDWLDGTTHDVGHENVYVLFQNRCNYWQKLPILGYYCVASLSTAA